ncbi:GNAT family N-acetyltransferase [Massilia consociata]|uniref:GNAT family N-acetyltransferase n=1 Tax=Massilia consociata TaxID=760117 RepID=A0ABV6FCW6_9BURK
MDSAPVIRRLLPQEWQAYRAIRLRALADAPDAFGSTLAAEGALAPDTWAARVAKSALSGIDCALVAEQAGGFVGLLWAKVDAQDAGRVNLFQMWVAPECRGRGVAAALLGEALGWARARGTRVVHLGVNRANGSAVRLYERAGFESIGAPYPLREGEPHLEQEMRLALSRSA